MSVSIAVDEQNHAVTVARIAADSITNIIMQIVCLKRFSLSTILLWLVVVFIRLGLLILDVWTPWLRRTAAAAMANSVPKQKTCIRV